MVWLTMICNYTTQTKKWTLWMKKKGNKNGIIISKTKDWLPIAKPLGHSKQRIIIQLNLITMMWGK